MKSVCHWFLDFNGTLDDSYLKNSGASVKVLDELACWIKVSQEELMRQLKGSVTPQAAQ